MVVIIFCVATPVMHWFTLYYSDVAVDVVL